MFLQQDLNFDAKQINIHLANYYLCLLFSSNQMYPSRCVQVLQDKLVDSIKETASPARQLTYICRNTTKTEVPKERKGGGVYMQSIYFLQNLQPSSLFAFLIHPILWHKAMTEWETMHIRGEKQSIHQPTHLSPFLILVLPCVWRIQSIT